MIIKEKNQKDSVRKEEKRRKKNNQIQTRSTFFQNVQKKKEVKLKT